MGSLLSLSLDCPSRNRRFPMWNIIPSLTPLVDVLAPTFTQPSAITCCHFLLGWIMCLGRHTLRRVAENTHPTIVPNHAQCHGLDTYYNFFERSAWTPATLAWRIGVLMFTRLPFFGRITLLVDDTLAHKRGKSVWGMGWGGGARPPNKKACRDRQWSQLGRPGGCLLSTVVPDADSGLALAGPLAPAGPG